MAIVSASSSAHGSALQPPVPWRNLLLLLLLVALFSSNMGWLNPSPGIRVSFRPIPNTPFFWQYLTTDAPNDFNAALRFPEFYRQSPARMERPAPSLTVNFIAETLHTLAAPFMGATLPTIDHTRNPGHIFERTNTLGEGLTVVSTIVALLLYKLMLFAAAMGASYAILRRMVRPEVALGAVWVLFCHPFALYSFHSAPAFDLEFITPILVLYLFLRLRDLEYLGRPMLGPTLLAGLGVGALMLGKTNYAVVLPLLALALLHGRLRWSGVVMAAHLIPMGLYLLYLKVVEIPLVSKSTGEGHRQLLWIFQDYPTLGLQGLIERIVSDLWRFGGDFWFFHQMLLPVSVVGVVALLIQKRWREFWFVWLMLAALFAQVFAADRYMPYMTADFWVVTVGLAAIGFDHFTRQRVAWARRGGALLVLLWVAFGIGSWVHLPWVHPLAQPTQKQKLSDGNILPSEPIGTFSPIRHIRFREEL